MAVDSDILAMFLFGVKMTIMVTALPAAVVVIYSFDAISQFFTRNGNGRR
jgi:hypothetical protein